MTLHYEITKAYHKNKELYICGVCTELEVDKPMHSLDNKVWIEHKVSKEDYSYLFAICKDHKRQATDESLKTLKDNNGTRITSKMYLSGYQQ